MLKAAPRRPTAEPLDGLPEDPYEGHRWLMAKVAELDAVTLTLHQEFQATDDPARHEMIRAAEAAVEWTRALLMERAAHLLAEVAPSPALHEAADALRVQARTDRRDWDAAGRRLAREARLPQPLRQPTRVRPRGRARRDRRAALCRAPARSPGRSADDDSDLADPEAVA